MKKISLLLAGVLFITFIGNAQTEKKNIVKVFPTSFVFGKGTFGYERVINENGSFTFNLGLPIKTDPFKYFSIPETHDIVVLGGNLDGLIIMPGYRFNLSKRGAPLGFYIEPYLKYEKFKADFHSEFIDDEMEHFESRINGSYSGAGLGFQVGIQYLISDVVSVEWSLLGFEGKSGKIDFIYNDLDGGVEINDVYNDLVDDFSKDIPIIGDKIEFEKGNGSVKGKASGFLLPGVRSAFSIGIAF